MSALAACSRARSPRCAAHGRAAAPRAAPRSARRSSRRRRGHADGHEAATPAPRTRRARRVAFGKELRPAREVVGRREEPLSLEEETPKQIEKLLRGPLRYGVTGLFVADARTGEPLFAVNADDPLNPASNVKMISTATALELLGPTFRYPTRLLGPTPDATGAIHGDVYLLGSYDPDADRPPTSTTSRRSSPARGVKHDRRRRRRRQRSDARRHLPRDGPDRDQGRRARRSRRPRRRRPASISSRSRSPRRPLKRARAPAPDVSRSTITTTPRPHAVTLTIGGTIGKGGETMYPLLDAASAPRPPRTRCAPRSAPTASRSTATSRSPSSATSSATRSAPARCRSSSAATIARRSRTSSRSVNKWSINWLADRVIMTAAALSRGTTPSMEVALDAMYAWLARHPQLAKGDVIVDTGSGLSYRTRITPHELVSIVRSAGGLRRRDADPTLAKAWLDSLSIAGTDGTLRHRFRARRHPRPHPRQDRHALDA